MGGAVGYEIADVHDLYVFLLDEVFDLVGINLLESHGLFPWFWSPLTVLPLERPERGLL
jgi:hypothetical protein